jgi:3-phytase
MAKLVLLYFILISSCLAQAKSWQLELYAQTTLPVKAALGKTKVGGLSGIFWTGSKLLAVSDDRGKFGSPRYYDLEMTITSKNVELKPLKSYPVKVPGPAWVMDLEAMVVLPNGDLLLSTEGDNNTKPRSLPHIFAVDTDGKMKYDLEIPEKFLPESLGQQKRGIENNRGFEGVTLSSDGQHLYTMNEAPIMTDSESGDCQTSWVRLIDFTKGETFKPVAEYPYQIEKSHPDDRGPELYRGVSEILSLEAQRILVLERGARLTKKGVSYTGAIYLYDFAGLKDVSKTANLCTPLQISGKKELLVDLDTVLKGDRLENFEGLSWGPALPDGHRSLLVISDNNFSSREKTQFLVFALKEVP